MKTGDILTLNWYVQVGHICENDHWFCSGDDDQLNIWTNKTNNPSTMFLPKPVDNEVQKILYFFILCC